MIGVIADAVDHEIVREFFELFKTPWEFFRQGQNYDVLLCAGNRQPGTTAKLVVVYAGRKTSDDEAQPVRISHEYQTPRFLTCSKGDRVPIYGHTLTFISQAGVLLKDEATQECAAYLQQASGHTRARIGYDLFQETRTLLTAGQPVANAQIPTLEHHIELLRHLITECGISLVEIPPVPDGYRFIACLTHDVDHPSIRLHKRDHTVFGFVYRATIGSVWKLFRGQISTLDLLKNWLAVLKLPFIYMGFVLTQPQWKGFGQQ